MYGVNAIKAGDIVKSKLAAGYWAARFRVADVVNGQATLVVDLGWNDVKVIEEVRSNVLYKVGSERPS